MKNSTKFSINNSKNFSFIMMIIIKWIFSVLQLSLAIPFPQCLDGILPRDTFSPFPHSFCFSFHNLWFVDVLLKRLLKCELESWRRM
ncbi:hypothetical protein Bca4012_030183 [Brassica carinata]|uniref:(rape) hypothetical protein n=1 Tax=Brassica napus TaxID=3708 RepID=A0A078J7F2_BRANA|nr:unnamed protein product [Brassica napus]CDY60969.1 BnaCnng37180D [Brassica napus]